MSTVFLFFFKNFSLFFLFFFRFFFPGDFPRFPAHSLRGGRLLSVTGDRGGFPRPADAGRGARRRRAHGRRMMTRGIGAARSVPRRPCRGWKDLPAAGTDCHAERGASLPRRLAPAWAARHGAGRWNRAKPGAGGVAPYIEKFLIISNGVFLDYLTQLNYN